MARYNRGSFSSTLLAAKKSATAQQRPLFIHPTAQGLNITHREDNAQSGYGYVKVHSDGKVERFSREPGSEWKLVDENHITTPQGLTALLGPETPDVTLGLRNIGRIEPVRNKYRAIAYVSDQTGTSMTSKHIGDYDSYDAAREVIVRMRNAEHLVIPDKDTFTSQPTEQEILASLMNPISEPKVQLISEMKVSESDSSFEDFSKIAKQYYSARKKFHAAQNDKSLSSSQLSDLGGKVDELRKKVASHPVNRAEFWKQNPELVLKLNKMAK